MCAQHLNQDHSACDRCMLHPFCRSAPSAPPLVTSRYSLKRREALYAYRDSFTNIYAIHSGAIKTYHVDLDGQERIHQFYLAGELLGFEAIHANHYPFSAAAIAHTQVCQVPYDKLIDFVFSRPELYRKILAIISQRFNFGQYVTAPSAEQRLASFLLEISQRLHAEHANFEFDIGISRQDIGHYLGLAAETISRVLTRFQESHLIEANSKKIKLLELAKLRWVAQDGVSR